MTLDEFQFLLSAAGQSLLTEMSKTAITPHNHLVLASKLRKQVDIGYAQAVLEIALLRQKATAKFSRGEQMYFTRPALEQASAEAVARHRAKRFAQMGLTTVVDMGCSVGGDALALAELAHVIGIEQNGVRLAMAQENTAVYGVSSNFQPLQADLLSLTPLQADALFFDPARRDERGRRFFSVAAYRPPLSLLNQWRKQTPHAAAKISPGIDYAELPPDAEVEFVSLHGEVKEALLWFGGLKTAVSRRATLLPSGDSITTNTLPSEKIAITLPQAYLYEPDGAIIRAHLVAGLAAQIGASQIDNTIAYLTSQKRCDTPFAKRYVVKDYFPFQLKRLRLYLRERQIGKLIIKKRGSPLEPQWLEKQLRLKGSQKAILFLTQIQGEASVIIGRLDH